MGGFELEEDEYHLFFEDPRLDGLEVVMSPPASIKESLAIDKLRRARDRAVEPEDLEKALEGLAEKFSEHLVSWNLTKKGAEVPCDAEGLLSSDGRIMLAIEKAYIQAVNGVPAPLAASSTDTASSSSDGSTSPEASTGLSIPMEPLSPNP